MLRRITKDIHEYLSLDPKNVAAVHCKAGKGRTGHVICAYLVYEALQNGVGIQGTVGLSDDTISLSDACMASYGEQRTHNGKGVTISSQRRYISYLEAELRGDIPMEDNPEGRARDERRLERVIISAPADSIKVECNVFIYGQADLT